MTTDFTALVEHLRIIELVNRFGIAIDLRDWDKLPSLFLDPVEYDYSSIGVESGHLHPTEIAATARRDLSGFQATQHLITNHQVEVAGDSATCQAHVRAMHFLPNEQGDSTFEMGGYYTITLVRTNSNWKVQRRRFSVLWSRGDQEIFSLARKSPVNQNNDIVG